MQGYTGSKSEYLDRGRDFSPQEKFAPVVTDEMVAALKGRAAPEYLKVFGFVPFFEYVNRKMLEQQNIKPVYEGSAEQKEKLFSQGGVLFSNHPSEYDLSIVYGAIRNRDRIRTDVLTLLEKDSYDELVESMGEASGLRPVGFRTIKQTFAEFNLHIKNGGLVVIFPSFKFERDREREIGFENGLAKLVSEMPSDSMVYSLAIDPEKLNIRNQDTFTVGRVSVSECYGTAKELQQYFVPGMKNPYGEFSKVLLDYYLEAPEHKKNLSSYKVKKF